jgi:hypothetical protein
MAKKDPRPLDAGLASLHGKDDATVVDWWKQRLTLIAAIPSEAARAGAVLPQFRELSFFPSDERRRLTKARMQAFLALPFDQQEQILAARRQAAVLDPDLFRSDTEVTDSVAAEVPGGADLQKRLPR